MPEGNKPKIDRVEGKQLGKDVLFHHPSVYALINFETNAKNTFSVTF